MWPVWDCIRNSAYMHTIPLHFCGHLCVEINQPQTLYAPPAIMGTSIGNTSRTLDSMPKLYAHGHPSTRFLANLAGWPYFVITSPAKPAKLLSHSHSHSHAHTHALSDSDFHAIAHTQKDSSSGSHTTLRSVFIHSPNENRRLRWKKL